MSDFSISQTKANASIEGVSLTADVPFPSTKRKGREHDDAEGSGLSCLASLKKRRNQPFGKAKSPSIDLKSKGTHEGSAHSGASAGAMPKVQQSRSGATAKGKKGCRVRDSSSHHVVSPPATDKNLQCDSKANIRDDQNSNLAVANAARSLRVALRTANVAYEQFHASQCDEDLDDWIQSWVNALALCPVGHRQRSDSLSSLGAALSTRFDRRGDRSDLEESVRHLREALSLHPVSHSDRSSTLNNLGNALGIRFDQNGDIADLEEGIHYLREDLSLCSIGHPDRAFALNNLGNLLKKRFDERGDIADLEECIIYFQEELLFYPIDHPDRASSLNSLGGMLGIRSHQKSDITDLDKGIYYIQEALSLHPIGHPDRSSTLSNLGNALGTRFDLVGDIADLDQSIRHFQEGLSLNPTGHPDRTFALNNLRYVLKKRFDQRGDVADLEESIRHCQEELSLCPVGHPDRASSLNDLGSVLGIRFDRRGDMNDLEESIRHIQEALSLHPNGHPYRLYTLNKLGGMLGRRFDQRGEIADLEESIRHHREALFLRPIGHPDRSSALNHLGLVLGTQFKQMNNMVDLVESIHLHEEALSFSPTGHPNRAYSLNNLGIALSTRFDRKGDISDLEKSIRHFQEALLLCTIGRPDRACCLSGLGGVLVTQFERWGDIGNLEESIEHHQEALSLHPIGDPGRSSALNNLGRALGIRFDWRGHMADLEECIHHYREALSLRPMGHPDRGSSLNDLGTAMVARFLRTGDVAELEESIHHYQESLSLSPIRGQDHPNILSNLGLILGTRFERRGEIVDLEKSIGHLQDSLSLYPVDHPGRLNALHNIGRAFKIRFGHWRDMADLQKSICHYREHLSLISIGHPDRSYSLNNLAMAVAVRFNQTSDVVDLHESIQHYKDAVGQSLSRLSDRLTSAHNWVVMARQHGLESLEDAYMAYMDLFDRSLLLAASSIPDTHIYMVQINRDAKTMTEDATSQAIEQHQLCTAVQIAERGRALLFVQLGNYRTPLNDLEAVNKGLADQFRMLSASLEESSTLSSRDAVTRLGVAGDQIARRQKMAANWDNTVEQIRRIEGFESFLGVAPFANLQKAATDGPIILVNVSHYRSDAIIVLKACEPLSIPLPDATPTAIEALANMLTKITASDPDQPKSDQSLVDILRDLWVLIVAPIVFQLETVLHLPLGSRIWWMPTSVAWWLPLHAAGPYRPDEKNLPDLFVSSYTPTLSSLIRARSNYQPMENITGPRVLVVAQAEAEGQITLPNAEVEVALIRRLQAQVTIVEGESCTKDIVLAGLKETTWVHFTCHGHRHPTEPFKSHFSLRTIDAPLTVLDIIKTGVPQAELAVLSACHSAAVDESTPDEAINLAAGILFAGFRSVVGTMWAMDDRDGPIMAEAFYKYMFRNGPEAVDCRDAAKALVMGVRGLRQKKVPLERWINFVHYGI
ncbi:hypothetical protein FRB94_010207 [Tulasnella sp. JGI-2019a]|nr:hypothetical protein FRB94_010207 [Tulasnella sp. JGI-2019a]